MKQPFVMSRYASLADLYKDKARFYESMVLFLAKNARNMSLSAEQFRLVALNTLQDIETEDKQ